MKVEIEKKDMPNSLMAATSNRMGVTVNNKLFSMMSDNIYSNIPNAIVRELVSNAIDASVIAGTKEPVVVHIPQNLGQDFYIQDFGCGMSIETMIHVFANYFSSTKENDETQIGGFGLGSKTPFAYVEEAGFRVETTSPDDGVRRTFEFKRIQDELGDKYPHYHHLEDLDIQNSSITGTKISFALKQEKDIELFLLACVPMLYSVHPIDFTGVDVWSYISLKNKEILKTTLDSLKNDGFFALSSKNKTGFHLNFDLSNLHFKNQKVVSTLNNNDLKNVLNLRLGSVIYPLKINAVNYGCGFDLFSHIQTMLAEMDKNLVMIDVQENGYIALDVSRENIRETDLNKKHIGTLLIKNAFSVASHLNKEIKSNLQKLEQSINPKLSLESALKLLKQTVKQNTALTNFGLYIQCNMDLPLFTQYDEQMHQKFEILSKEIKEFKNQIDGFENEIKNKLENVFLKNFGKTFIDGEVLLKKLNSKTELILLGEKLWNKINENKLLKDLILKNFKTTQFLLPVKDEQYWEKELKNFNSDDESAFYDFIKEHKNTKEIKSIDLSFEDIMSENNEFKEWANVNRDAYCFNFLVLPFKYHIYDINDLSNKDKVFLMIYDLLGKIFGFSLSDGFSHHLQNNHSVYFKQMSEMNDLILKQFPIAKLKNKKIILKNHTTLPIKFSHAYHHYNAGTEAEELLKDLLKSLFHAKSSISYNETYRANNVKKPFIIERFVPTQWKLDNLKEWNDDEISKYIANKIKSFANDENKTSNVTLNNLFDVVFRSIKDGENALINHFENKYHLSQLAKEHLSGNLQVIDKETFEKNVSHNRSWHTKSGLSSYMNNIYIDNFYLSYVDENDLAETKKSFFNMIAKLKALTRNAKKKDMNFDVQDVGFDMELVEVNKPKNPEMKDLDNIIKTFFEKEMPVGQIPKNKTLALLMKIAEEQQNQQ